MRLRLRDWPGPSGPIVHLPDPLSTEDGLVESLAASLPRQYRLLSLQPRGTSPYQVDAADILALLEQFGFDAPVLVAEQLGCVAALLVAAWHAHRVAGLVLIEPPYDPPVGHSLAARALRDCPPDWAALHQAVQCRVLVLPRSPELRAAEQVEQFVTQLVPRVT